MGDGYIDSENTLRESLARSGLMVYRQLPEGLAGADAAFRARQLDHPLVDAKISFKGEGVDNGLVEGRGRSDRLAERSEASGRGDDHKETHDDVVSTTGGSIDRSGKGDGETDNRSRRESMISKEEGMVSVDLGLERGE